MDWPTLYVKKGGGLTAPPEREISMKQIRQDRVKLWYVVSHPFTRPVVTGPLYDRHDAIALACKRTDYKSLITHISRGESWVGGEVVCSAYRLHVNGWTALAPKKADARLDRPSKYGRVT
jgi:hypothetical protein